MSTFDFVFTACRSGYSRENDKGFPALATQTMSRETLCMPYGWLFYGSNGLELLLTQTAVFMCFLEAIWL